MTSLPSGTVAFLFTDIEGSTTLWERYPDVMESVITRHDMLLRRVVDDHHGVVFKMVGDACCAAFTVASDALLAAVGAQRALAAEEWGEAAGLRVRMAIHTGDAEERDGDYFGQNLNRVARLLSAAHGGQILVSHATVELLQDSLPPGIALQFLGEHHLKDLIRPESISQVVVPDLPSEFPPLRVLDPQLTNLPLQTTPFIGREQEVEDVVNMMRRPDVRLLTLTGPGGTGKTRLALQVAAKLVDIYAGGVFFVPLAAVTQTELVVSTIAETLHVREQTGTPILSTLIEALRAKEILLVLDNFEQVVETASVVTRLLSSCPELNILVTSRIVLRLSGEWEYPVPALSLPDTGRLASLGTLSQNDAVALFIDRARTVRPDFSLTMENAPAIAEICHRLDGLPLAIELGAARIRLLPPQALLTRLQSRLKLLTGGSRDRPTRQQTLRGAIDWSYNLLGEEEKLLFARLSVFARGCFLEAAEAVCQVEQDIDVIDGIASLVEKSLLKQDIREQNEPRFVMLETIREYAVEKLTEYGETETIRDRHAVYYLEQAERTQPQLTGPEQRRSVERLEQEHDNLRTALGWWLEQKDGERSQRMAGALWYFWLTRGHFTEGCNYLLQSLTFPSDRRLRARALRAAGVLLAWLANFKHAVALLEESLELAREVGDQQVIADCHTAFGTLASVHGDHERAHSLHTESLALYRELGDRHGIALALGLLGNVAWNRGENEQARVLYEESLGIWRKLGAMRGIDGPLIGLGLIALRQGEHTRAQDLLEESLLITRELGDKRGISFSLNGLGQVALEQGDCMTAQHLLREALTIAREMGSRKGVGITSCLAQLSLVAAQQGKNARAALLWGAAEAMRLEVGPKLSKAEQAHYDFVLNNVRREMGDQNWNRALDEGRTMSLDQVLAEALDAHG